jgi:transposase
MALTIVEEARSVTGGVDTHAGTHVAAALDPVGGLLGVREFPATAAGYSRALVLTGPDDLRTRFARHTPAALITGLASLRPRTGDVAGHATRIALRELGRRARFPDGQLQRLDELIVPLVTAHAPGLLALYGVGPRTAALLLITARRSPRPAAQRGGLGALVRRRPDPGIIGESHPPPAQPRR